MGDGGDISHMTRKRVADLWPFRLRAGEGDEQPSIGMIRGIGHSSKVIA